MSSPWWYRFRSAVFAFIYVVGFVLGTRVMHAPHYTPAFVTLGAYLGPSGPGALLALAIALTVLCVAIRAWGSSYLSAALVWNANARTDALIVAGPFRYTRNPLYLGNVFLAFGFGLLAPVPGALFILVANAVFIAALIRHEETLMGARYRNAFRVYCSQVPRLLPRIVPAPSQTGVQPSLFQGLRSELFTAAISVGLFAWILVPVYGVYLFFILYAAGVLAQRAVDQRA